MLFTMRPSTFLLSTMLLTTPIVRADEPKVDKPPVAPIRTVTDNFFGTPVPDPYRYFENLADPEVQRWIKGQAAFAARSLHAIPHRDALLARIRELDEGTPFHIGIIRRWPDGGLHYMKRLASENLDKLYYRDAQTRVEKLLIDPERFAQPGIDRHYSLSFCRPSPDRRYIAYGMAASGSEQTTLRVLDTTTGSDLPDVIDRMEADYLPPCWLADSTGFTYSRRPLLPKEAPATEVYKRSCSLVHRLGTDPDKDPIAFAMNVSRNVPMLDTDFPAVYLSSGSKFAVGQIKHGDESKITLYAAPIDTLGTPQTAWQKVCDLDDEVTEYAIHGDEIYLLTSAGAPRFRP